LIITITKVSPIQSSTNLVSTNRHNIDANSYKRAVNEY
jgi:hypothetical protein